MAPCWCWIAAPAGCFPSWRPSSPMARTAATSCAGPWPMPPGASRWSSGPPRPGASRSSPNAGSSNAPSPGSIAAAASPRTTRTSTVRLSPSSAWPASGSCSEGLHDAAIHHKLSGRTLMLEGYLSEMESLAPSLIRRLIAGEDLEAQDRMHWAEFLAAMHVRGPNARQMVAEMAVHLSLRRVGVATATEERYNALTERMKKDGFEPKVDITHEKFRQYLTEGDFDAVVDEQSTLKSFTLIEKLANVFFDMEWNILKIVPKDYFVTSDTPVVYSSPPKTHHPLYGDGGLLNKRVELLFPLNRRAMFVGTWEKFPSASLPAFGTEMLNRRIIGQAFRHIYAPARSPKILEIAKRTRGGHRRVAEPDFPAVNVKRRSRIEDEP